MFRLREHRPAPQRLSDWLPWALLVAPGVLMHKTGALQRCWDMQGHDLASSGSAELAHTAAQLSGALQRLGSDWGVHVEARRAPITPPPHAPSGPHVVRLLSGERHARLAASRGLYATHTTLTLTYQPPRQDTKRSWFERLFEGEQANQLTTDALDERIVEAYWVGNELLARVQHTEWGWHLHDRFTGRNRSGARAVLETVGDGGLANHAFHVFEVYPWMGMLREGRGGDEPLRIMDRCRIRPGVVTAVSSGLARVLCRPLEWDGVRLMLGAARPEEAILSTVEVTVGDVVALHWDWVCQVLAPRQAGWLDRVTMQQLALVERHHTLLRTGY